LQRLDLQFYSFFTIILCGAVLGLLFDLLRVTRRYYQPNWLAGAAEDLLFWAVATAALAGGLFYGNWGELRFYVLVGLLLGLGLYSWLASPFVRALMLLVLRLLGWLVHLAVMLIIKLVWAPLLALIGLLWAGVTVLWRWMLALSTGIWHGLEYLLGWLAQPLVGPYRLFKLHYLLRKRRFKRRLRHWLLGPPKHRRR
jgi:spore cortex biosynthesis protein YabQ